jgi:hypothetical protein
VTTPAAAQRHEPEHEQESLDQDESHVEAPDRRALRIGDAMKQQEGRGTRQPGGQEERAEDR